jgi:transcriptional regulator with XRE-family HTH domain
MAVMLGRDLNIARRRRGLTQAQLGRSMGLSGARIGELERGDGATAPLDVWVRLGETMNRPLAMRFSQETDSREPDARLLAAQEVVLDLAQQHGRRTDVELPTRLADPARSIDVVLQDDAARSLIIVEIRNALDDLQEAADSISLKLADASGPAALAAGDGSPYRVSLCWLLVDRAANRRLVAESPEILDPRFTGSSVRWVRCLGSGAPPPAEMGLAWIDLRRRRIVPFRRRRGT